MERGFGWHYPPGTPAPASTIVEMKCVNEECPEYGVVVELPATTELGATFLNDDSDTNCPACGQERKDV